MERQNVDTSSSRAIPVRPVCGWRTNWHEGYVTFWNITTTKDISMCWRIHFLLCFGVSNVSNRSWPDTTPRGWWLHWVHWVLRPLNQSFVSTCSSETSSRKETIIHFVLITLFLRDLFDGFLEAVVHHGISSVFTQVVLWGTAPWLSQLPQTITPEMRTGVVFNSKPTKR